VGRKRGMSLHLKISGISSSSFSFFVVVLKVREGEERRGAWREQMRNWEEKL
jgi:hypothetical protein